MYHTTLNVFLYMAQPNSCTLQLMLNQKFLFAKHSLFIKLTHIQKKMCVSLHTFKHSLCVSERFIEQKCRHIHVFFLTSHQVFLNTFHTVLCVSQFYVLKNFIQFALTTL